MTLQYPLMDSAKQMDRDQWLKEVTAAETVNMPMADWQNLWPFDFQAQYAAGVTPDDAAMKANRYWWHEQNKSQNRNCRETKDCWLPRGHQGICEPGENPVG
jgi:hypothetical protein